MITIVINGQSFDYPEVGDTEWGDAATNAFQALAATTLQKIGGSFTLQNDIVFGGGKGIHCLFFTSSDSNPAQSGVYRLCNNELVAWRNVNNDNDNSISFDASDNFVINGNTISFDVNGEMLVNGVQVTRSGEIVNADVAAAAGIEESKLALDHSTQSLYDNIENHKADTNNPHDTTISNLDDTTITSATTDDSLVYNGSKWINQANSVDNLKNVNITSIQDDEILSYDSNSTKWINTTNSVDNLSNVSITSVQDKNILAYDSNDSLWKNITNSVNNLDGVSVTTPTAGQVLTYDGSNWTNQASASASLTGLTDTTITTPVNNDVLVYDSVSTKWKNSDGLTTVSTNLSNHTTNTSNPHSTTISNLDDTTITTPSDQDTIVYDNNSSKWINQENSINNLTNVSIDSNTLAVGDALVFDDQDSLWKNDASFTNHIGNTSNPHLTTVAKLTDTTITTPANNDVLLYDYANSQWINSPIIEINDIANINTATTDVTLTSSDKRHQIFTATDGFNITLPSTNIKAGEKFILEFTQDGAFSTTSMSTYAGSNFMNYAHIGNFNYIYTALVDNPSLATDWLFEYRLRKKVFLYKASTVNGNCPQNIRSCLQTGTLLTPYAGVWKVNYHTSYTSGGSIDVNNPWVSYLVTIEGTSPYARTVLTSRGINEVVGISNLSDRPKNRSLTITDANTTSFDCWNANNINKTAEVTISKRSVNIGANNSIYNVSTAATIYCNNNITFYLEEPVAETNIT